MLATNAPFPPNDAGWAYEAKWDGWRTVITVDDAVTVHTRRGRNATDSFPELAGMADALAGRRVVLDAELVAARNGALDFWALGGRWSAPKTPTGTSIAFLAFDVLWLDGDALTHHPLRERETVLASLRLDGPAWREAPRQTGDGGALLAACDQLGLEGVVAKRLDSIYRPAVRSTLWRKKKCRAWLEEQGARRIPTRGPL